MHGTDPVRGPGDGRPAPAPGEQPRPFRPGDAVVWRNRFLLLLDRVQSPLAVCRTDGTMVIANPAMAAQWNASPGRLPGRNALELFRPREREQLQRLVEALRLGHRSRYPIEVHWRTGGAERSGELSVDPVSEATSEQPALLAQLRVRDTPHSAPDGGRRTPGRQGPGEPVGAVEARILALAAAGATTTSIAGSVGLSVDGVNYHLTRLSKRWNVPNRTALVARAYVLGVLDASVWPPRPDTAVRLHR